MITSYKDKTWCRHNVLFDCANTECGRFFSDKDAINARRWWGGPNYLIDFADMRIDDCGHKPIKVKG